MGAALLRRSGGVAEPLTGFGAGKRTCAPTRAGGFAIVMGGISGLSPKHTVSEGLLSFAADIIAEGRAALATPGLWDAAAVHDFRKAMKRWRAFLRLIEPSVGEPAARLRIEARDIARALGAARNAQSALDALADLRQHDAALPARAAAALAGRLEALRREAEAAALTDDIRERMRLSLEAAAAALREWPLGDLHVSDLAAGLAEGYRRARAATPRKWLQADPEELHRLRTRVVVHRYQMDALAPLWPRFAKFWVGEAQRLREHLGGCQDLAVLAALAGPDRPLAAWGARLAPLVAERQAAHVAAAARIAARLFAEKPGAFRRRILAVWENARALA